MQQRYFRFVRFGIVLSSLLAVACGDGEDDVGGKAKSCPAVADDGIEITGDWVSNFGGTESIDSTTWGEAAVTEFDNDENFAVTQNADDAEFSPGLFNRLVWTERDPDDDCSFYYCWVSIGRDSAADARDSDDTADASDPETTGCGGFPWTKLTPE